MMETKRWTTYNDNVKGSFRDQDAQHNNNRCGTHEAAAWLEEAAETLQGGGLVAFPTETVYGLGADARNTDAVAGIFRAKGRPSDNPLIVHIADSGQLDELVKPYPPLAGKLMELFWPGPLTIVLPVQSGALSPLVTANLPTVGVRMPDHPLALELLRRAGCPVAAPSANRSGRPSPTEASHVLDDLDGLIHGIVDGGATGVGLESTVVELLDEQTVAILRPGGITLEKLRRALPDIAVLGGEDGLSDQEEAPRSPGMKYIHYAPQGELTLVEGSPEQTEAYIAARLAEASARGERTGVLAFSESIRRYEADVKMNMGSRQRLDEAAARLYAALRRFDEEGAVSLWAESCSEEGIGRALMNRLSKAASKVIKLN
nr:L-threonylcarbamoyladenylate synthase [Paenibacillus oryzae]